MPLKMRVTILSKAVHDDFRNDDDQHHCSKHTSYDKKPTPPPRKEMPVPRYCHDEQREHHRKTDGVKGHAVQPFFYPAIFP